MLKKTSASIGLTVATAAGILLSGAPAQAQSNSIYGCCISHHSRIRHHSSNWNGNRPRIFVRIFIYNRNNNVAVARNGQRQHQRERQFQIERRRRRGLGGLGLAAPAEAPAPAPVLAPQDLRGRGVLAPAPLIGPARTRSVPVNAPVNAAPQVGHGVPLAYRAPRDNGQISRNGIIHPIQGGDSQGGQPGAEEYGQNGIQANPGMDDLNQDIGRWLQPALS